MNGKSFDILVLDKDYQIISILNYTLLQWTRKYFEAGTFSVEIPIELYSSDMKYIYTKNRPEVGEITQVNYYIKDGYKSAYLSGYFLENEVNKRVAYYTGKTTNIINNPSWEVQSGKAEDVAYTFFDAFKDVRWNHSGAEWSSDLGIETGTNLHRGNDAEHTRTNDQLGDKIYQILKPSQMSYRVKYDFETSTKTFEVWKGLDRTQDNTDNNNPVVFSTSYGNITKCDVLINSTDYRQCYIVGNGSASSSSTDNTHLYAGAQRASGETALDDAFIYVNGSVPSDSTTNQIRQNMYAQGREALLAHKKEVSLDFDTLEGSYEYREDFDLGDVCSIEIKELGLSVDAVLSGCVEVVKNGAWSLSLEFTLID